MTGILRVLLVEDNPGDADLIVELLPDKCEVVVAARISEAREHAGAERFDILLLDLGLPDSNGLDTLRTMRLYAVELPIIVMTGNNDEQMGLAAIREGAQDYLIKGQIAQNLLVRSIKYAVERKQTENALKELNATLEERIVERTAQLTSANETLQFEIAVRRRTEDALRISHDRINAILEQMSDGFAAFDHDWRYTFINPAAAKAFQTTPEQLLGKSIWEMWPPAYDLPLGANFRRSLQENIPIQFEEFYPAPLNRWFECRCHPTSEGLVTFFSDITERKQSEEELRQSEERFRIMGEILPYGVWWCNAHGGAEYCSQSFLDLIEMSMDEMREFGWSNRLPLDEIEPMMKRWMHCVQTGEDWDDEHHVLGPDGKYHTILTRGRPVRDNTGSIVGWAGINLDIDERKRLEEVLKKLNEELDSRVAERTAELRDKDQLLLIQSRQAAMGEMIGNIAHQWRQPLNTLGLIVQQLPFLYDIGELSKESLDKSTQQSMNLILHMSKTIDDFRNFFRPDKEMVEFKVSEAIITTLSLIEDSFKSHRIRIEVNTKHDPAINGYPNEYSQALLNILNNARDALIEREVDDPRVTINISADGDRAVVTISDNAGGIPEEIMRKIFDPYFTTKGPQSGTGVGLFMSKTIIEKNMGGMLAACNIANGAEFRIEV
jgi:PAS domain S-box-containing protein